MSWRFFEVYLHYHYLGITNYRINKPTLSNFWSVSNTVACNAYIADIRLLDFGVKRLFMNW